MMLDLLPAACPTRRRPLHGNNALRSGTGYTLIELMIVLVILGVLGSWAIPAYFEQVRDSRRSDALSSINRVLAQQELFYTNNGSQYTLFAASLGYDTYSGNNAKLLSEDSYYALELKQCEYAGSTEQECIRVEAVAVAGTSQAKDKACATIAINSKGRQEANPDGATTNNPDCF